MEALQTACKCSCPVFVAGAAATSVLTYCVFVYCCARFGRIACAVEMACRWCAVVTVARCLFTTALNTRTRGVCGEPFFLGAHAIKEPTHGLNNTHLFQVHPPLTHAHTRITGRPIGTGLLCRADVHREGLQPHFENVLAMHVYMQAQLLRWRKLGTNAHMRRVVRCT